MKLGKIVSGVIATVVFFIAFPLVLRACMIVALILLGASVGGSPLFLYVSMAVSLAISALGSFMLYRYLQSGRN